MKTIDDIVFDPKVEWESDGWQSRLDYNQVSTCMKDYAKEIIKALVEKVGYYEDDDIIYSGSSEYSAIVDEERLNKFLEELA